MRRILSAVNGLLLSPDPRSDFLIIPATRNKKKPFIHRQDPCTDMKKVVLTISPKSTPSLLMNDKTRKPEIFTLKICAVFVSVLLLGGSGFLAADASGLPLNKQVQSGIENKYLKCNNPDHLLVIRQSLQLSCVTDESASKLGWPKVRFLEDNDMIVDYTPLQVEADGEKFQINCILKNGLIQKDLHYDLGGLVFGINSIKEGKAKLEIPQSFFKWFEPEKYIYHEIVIFERLGFEQIKIIEGNVKFEQDRYIVEFSFSDNDPEIEVHISHPV
ncbi:MAG: hypothetical protein D9C04_04505 [Nitrosopumilus sp. B06]|nr:MAG: hypothetical protein D9C04_04505 [Nitrosopumilus sp. B06]